MRRWCFYKFFVLLCRGFWWLFCRDGCAKAVCLYYICNIFLFECILFSSLRICIYNFYYFVTGKLFVNELIQIFVTSEDQSLKKNTEINQVWKIWYNVISLNRVNESAIFWKIFLILMAEIILFENFSETSLFDTSFHHCDVIPLFFKICILYHIFICFCRSAQYHHRIYNAYGNVNYCDGSAFNQPWRVIYRTLHSTLKFFPTKPKTHRMWKPSVFTREEL